MLSSILVVLTLSWGLAAGTTNHHHHHHHLEDFLSKLDTDVGRLEEDAPKHVNMYTVGEPCPATQAFLHHWGAARGITINVHYGYDAEGPTGADISGYKNAIKGAGLQATIQGLNDKAAVLARFPAPSNNNEKQVMKAVTDFMEAADYPEPKKGGGGARQLLSECLDYIESSDWEGRDEKKHRMILDASLTIGGAKNVCPLACLLAMAPDNAIRSCSIAVTDDGKRYMAISRDGAVRPDWMLDDVIWGNTATAKVVNTQQQLVTNTAIYNAANRNEWRKAVNANGDTGFYISTTEEDPGLLGLAGACSEERLLNSV